MPSHSRWTSHGSQAEQAPEREERPHREQVAAVLAALDVPEVLGRRPRGRDVAEEPQRVDVEADLRVRAGFAGSLEQRERERERRQARGDEALPAHAAVILRGLVGCRAHALPSHVLAVPLLLGPGVLALFSGGYSDTGAAHRRDRGVGAAGR